MEKTKQIFEAHRVDLRTIDTPGDIFRIMMQARFEKALARAIDQIADAGFAAQRAESAWDNLAGDELPYSTIAEDCEKMHQLIEKFYNSEFEPMLKKYDQVYAKLKQIASKS